MTQNFTNNLGEKAGDTFFFSNTKPNLISTSSSIDSLTMPAVNPSAEKNTNSLVTTEGLTLCAEIKTSLKNRSSKVSKIKPNELIEETINYLKAQNFDKTVSAQRMETKIVPMHLVDIDGIRNEGLKKHTLVEALENSKDQYNIPLGEVDTFSLKNYLVFLFFPKHTQAIYDNFKIIKHYMPEVDSCVINSFIVKAGTHAYGVHHAADGIVDENFNINRVHKSFHTVLQDTPYQSQPLVIFEGLNNQMSSLLNMYEVAVDGAIPEKKSLLDKALIAATFPKDTSDVFVGKDYLIAAYYEKESCENINNPKYFGYFANLKAGEALFFDNYRLHGASSLPISSSDRVALDYRCFKNLPVDDNNQAMMVDSGVSSFAKQLPKAAACWYKIFPNQSEEMMQMLQSPSGIYNLTLIKIDEQEPINPILKRHFEDNEEFFQQEIWHLSKEVLECIADELNNSQDKIILHGELCNGECLL